MTNNCFNEVTRTMDQFNTPHMQIYSSSADNELKNLIECICIYLKFVQIHIF